MGFSSRLGSTISADSMKIELGEKCLYKEGQAKTARQLGMVFANTDEGMLRKTIHAPEGILAVNEKYILDQMTRADYSALDFGHRTGDNHLKVKGFKTYAIAPGVVFVHMPGLHAANFETNIKPLDHNELDIPRSPCVHFNENAEVTIKDVPTGRPGRGGMGD